MGRNFCVVMLFYFLTLTSLWWKFYASRVGSFSVEDIERARRINSAFYNTSHALKSNIDIDIVSIFFFFFFFPAQQFPRKYLVRLQRRNKFNHMENTMKAGRSRRCWNVIQVARGEKQFVPAAGPWQKRTKSKLNGALKKSAISPSNFLNFRIGTGCCCGELLPRFLFSPAIFRPAYFSNYKSEFTTRFLLSRAKRSSLCFYAFRRRRRASR